MFHPRKYAIAFVGSDSRLIRLCADSAFLGRGRGMARLSPPGAVARRSAVHFVAARSRRRFVRPIPSPALGEVQRHDAAVHSDRLVDAFDGAVALSWRSGMRGCSSFVSVFWEYVLGAAANLSVGTARTTASKDRRINIRRKSDTGWHEIAARAPCTHGRPRNHAVNGRDFTTCLRRRARPWVHGARAA